MTSPSATPLNDDIRARLDALDIDVSCALRFSRATLQALAAMSDEARQAIDRCLAEEAAIVRIENLAASAAIAATLNEARHHIITAPRDSASAAVRDIERMLVEHAADLSGASNECEFSGEARRAACGG